MSKVFDTGKNLTPKQDFIVVNPDIGKAVIKAIKNAKDENIILEYTIPGFYSRPGGIIKTKEE